MSREQLQQVGAVMASHVDMLKGFLGDQFAVSVIARHKQGPFHLLLGDDAELALIQTLSELQRIGKHLVRCGEDGTVTPVQPGDADEPTEWDHMVNVVREVTELSLDDMEGLIMLRGRAAKVLDMVTPKDQLTTSDATGGGVNAALAPGRKVTVTTPGSVTSVGNATDSNLGPLLPEGETGPFTIGDMPDAPAVDGRPE